MNTLERLTIEEIIIIKIRDTLKTKNHEYRSSKPKGAVKSRPS